MMNDELRIKNHESRKRAPIPRYSFFIIHSSFFIIHCSSFFIIHSSFTKAKLHTPLPLV